MTKRKRLIIIFSVVVSLAVLIIINSAVFSVRTITAHGMNIVNQKLDDEIAERKIHDIRRGANIFTLSERRVVENANRNLAQSGQGRVDVRGIERVFPNRVRIHYVWTYEYVYVSQGGQAFVFDNRGVIVSILTTQEEIRQSDAIEIRVNGSLGATDLLDGFISDELQIERFNAVLSAVEWIKYTDFTSWFRFIDIRGDAIYFATDHGVFIRISNLENIINQFTLAATLYRDFVRDSNPNMSRGVIIANNTRRGAVVHHEPNTQGPP